MPTRGSVDRESLLVAGSGHDRREAHIRPPTLARTDPERADAKHERDKSFGDAETRVENKCDEAAGEDVP